MGATPSSAAGTASRRRGFGFTYLPPDRRAGGRWACCALVGHRHRLRSASPRRASRPAGASHRPTGSPPVRRTLLDASEASARRVGEGGRNPSHQSAKPVRGHCRRTWENRNRSGLPLYVRAKPKHRPSLPRPQHRHTRCRRGVWPLDRASLYCPPPPDTMPARPNPAPRAERRNSPPGTDHGQYAAGDFNC